MFSTLVSCKESWMALARSSSSCWLLTTRGSWWRIFYYPPDWCCLTNEKYFLSFSTKPKKVRSVMQLFDLPVGAQISFWDLPPRCWSQYLPSFKRHIFMTFLTQQLCWILNELREAPFLKYVVSVARKGGWVYWLTQMGWEFFFHIQMGNFLLLEGFRSQNACQDGLCTF